MNVFTTESKTNCDRSNSGPIYDLLVELKDRIREARLKTGLNQSELAARCGVKPSAINHQESGKARSISGELLMNLAKLSKTRPEWIFWGDGDMDASDSFATASPAVTWNQAAERLITILRDQPAVQRKMARTFLEHELIGLIDGDNIKPSDGQGHPPDKRQANGRQQ